MIFLHHELIYLPSPWVRFVFVMDFSKIMSYLAVTSASELCIFACLFTIQK
jgi:hypothetical protein